jgi:protein involved in ribonucleotide reduction
MQKAKKALTQSGNRNYGPQYTNNGTIINQK